MKCLLVDVLILATVVSAQLQILEEFAGGNNAFGADVYKKVIQSQPGSFSVCPLSVEILLAVFHAGAQGTTAQQVAAGLHLPNDRTKIEATFAQLSPHLQGNEHYSLSCANKIYIKNGFRISNQYRTTVTTVFNAEIQNINFARTTQAARIINTWVAQKTNHKITNVISSDDLRANSAAVLVNAMYFHGKWVNQFGKGDTKSRTFYLDNTSKVDIDMMEVEDSFNYYESAELGATFLEMPYEGGDVTMTLVLPNDKQGLPLLEARIADVLTAPRYASQTVHAVLPKFRIETTISFAPILQALGIVEPFSDTADFSGMGANQQPLKISKVIQKTFIEVNEVGTKAAAASAGGVILLSGNYRPPAVKQFIADHPFVYYIKVKGVVLFLGRYSRP